MQKIKKEEQVDLKDNLIFAGTIYDSFEALEETMGKLKLERPLFLVYLAKKAFAEEVFQAAGEDVNVDEFSFPISSSAIILNRSDYQQMH